MTLDPRTPWLELFGALAALGLLALCLSGCASEPAQRGTAVAASNVALARAEAVQHAADTSARDEAAAAARAANAEAAAAAAAEVAAKTPTAALIEAAAAARVAAVRAADDARIAAAIAAADRRTASEAAVAASKAADAAQAEQQAAIRAAQRAEAERWCMWLGIGALIGSALSAAFLVYTGRPMAALAVLVTGTGLALIVPIFGASLPWLATAAPWVLLALLTGILLAGLWASRHIGLLRAIIAAPTHDDLAPGDRALAIRLGWTPPEGGAA